MNWEWQEETREWHCVVNPKDCYRILEALKAQGLDVELVAREDTGNPVLKVACIFDGPDADPNAERWKSYQEKD